MAWWPSWGRRAERRESFTDLLVAAAVERASGKTDARIGATGALQAASGMVSRAFAAATVEAPGNLAAAVSPFVRSQIARALMRTGEHVAMIDVDPEGIVSLRPASHWDVQGDIDPASWVYRVTMAGPSVTRTRYVPAAGVVHCRAETDAREPWRGIGPLQSASLAGRLSAETLASLTDQERSPRGGLLPLPVDGEDPTVAALKTDIRNLSGQIAFVESTQTMHGGAPGSAPRGDWDVKRIGADPPRAEVELLTQAGLEVVNACGAAGLFEGGDGTAAREAYRRWMHSTVQPLGALVSAELSEKLDAPISLDFGPLMASDLAGKARGFQSLVGGGMDVERAAGLAGLVTGGDE